MEGDETPRAFAEISPDEGHWRRRRSLLETATRGSSRRLKRTLVIYSGPTSVNRFSGKNGMYLDNMDYFLQHGISCLDNDERPSQEGDAEAVVVNYVIVVTREVADHYLGVQGIIRKKEEECRSAQRWVQKSRPDPLIRVIVREDRCYDMESMRVVLQEIDVRNLYDYLVFVNCGLVGPRFGPGSPKGIPRHHRHRHKQKLEMVPYSHWTQLYTSRLTSSVRMVGHSINTHFYTYFPHVQSFLYAIHTRTVSILLSSGAIYDCGLSQQELGTDAVKREELIHRYEVGMSTELIKRGFKIASPFVNRGEMGQELLIDENSTFGMEFDPQLSDIWYEDGVRNLTQTMPPNSKWWKDIGNAFLRKKEDTFNYHKYDILPWDYFVFFKVSRLVPEDIQQIMHYNTLVENQVPLIPNDPRKSPSEYWRRKMGVFVEEKPPPPRPPPPPPKRRIFRNKIQRNIAVITSMAGFICLVLFVRRKRLLRSWRIEKKRQMIPNGHHLKIDLQ